MKTVKMLMLALVVLYNIVLAKDFADTFLRLSPDAVSRSIGGPNQAYSVGAADIFINPALLSEHAGRELQFSSIVHSDFFQYVNGAFSMPITGKDHIGVGLLWANIPDARDFGIDGFNAGEFDNYQFAAIVGYARDLSPFSIGVNIKYLRVGFNSSETDNNGGALGFDAGLHYTLKKVFKFGFIYQSSFDIKWNNEARSAIPQRMAFGADWAPFLFSKNFIHLLAGLEQLEAEPLQMNVGMIFTFFQSRTGLHDLNVRLGYGNYELTSQNRTGGFENLTEWERNFRVGLGLHMAFSKSFDLGLDYCFQIEKDLDNQHIITTSLSF